MAKYFKWEGQRMLILRDVRGVAYRGLDKAQVMLCKYPEEHDELFNYVILVKTGNYISDKWGYGGMRSALKSMRENISYTMTGVWPWVVDKANKEAARLVPME